MKTISINVLSRISLFLFLVASLLMASCSDDPQSTNEEEVITTVIVTLDPVEVEDEAEGEVVTLSWDDTNLDAIVDDAEVIVSGPLVEDETYDASIQMLNRSVDSEVDITKEIAKEAEDHIFCFTVSGVKIAVTNRSEDKNGLPVGITSTWTTTTLSSGTVNITLRHQPGLKTGDCPGAGDTDASITFTVSVVPDPNEEGRL